MGFQIPVKNDNNKIHGDRHQVDVIVGKKLREKRINIGMSQDFLGKMLGISFQQVQKYENGANRIGASRLFDVAEILQVPISYFFEDLNCKQSEAKDKFFMKVNSNETNELVCAFESIDKKNRKLLLNFVRALANSNERNC